MSVVTEPSASRSRKSDAAFRTISEVAAELDVPQHVLRFWESKFTQVKPLKRGGGRRYYRPEDVALLKRIRSLLYDDGLTIKGVQKLFREHGVKVVVEGQNEPIGSTYPVHAKRADRLKGNIELSTAISELKDMQVLLKAALAPEQHAKITR